MRHMLTERLAGLMNECGFLDWEKPLKKNIPASHSESVEQKYQIFIHCFFLCLYMKKRSELNEMFLVCLGKRCQMRSGFPVTSRHTLTSKWMLNPWPVTFLPSMKKKKLHHACKKNLNLQMNLDPFKVFHYKTLPIQHRFYFLCAAIFVSFSTSFSFLAAQV